MLIGFTHEFEAGSPSDVVHETVVIYLDDFIILIQNDLNVTTFFDGQWVPGI